MVLLARILIVQDILVMVAERMQHPIPMVAQQ